MQKCVRFDIIFTVRGVAQFGSALGSGPRGRGFKSRRLDQKHRRDFSLRCFCLCCGLGRASWPHGQARSFSGLPRKRECGCAGKGGTSHAATPRGTQRRAYRLCSDAVRDQEVVGSNPVASTKTPRWHFCRLGVFAVVRGLNHSRRNVWKCDALFSAVGSRERTPAVAKPSSLS